MNVLVTGVVRLDGAPLEGILVEAYGSQTPLNQVGTVGAQFLKIGYELWRQANGFPPTVAMRGSPANGLPAVAAP